VEASPEAFVLAATGRQRTRAEALLAERPELADDPWAALTLGRAWHGNPSTPGGPRGWAPILYVCHSCFPSAALARELLDRGADPNASFENEYGSMSALYGAAGVAHEPELTRVLLEAGASPDDGESVYHATESPDTACLELLLAHGAATRGTNALAHALDDERLEHVRLLLAAGADPNEGAIVAHAVRRGRGPEVVRLLAQHRADLDRPAARRGAATSRCGRRTSTRGSGRGTTSPPRSPSSARRRSSTRRTPQSSRWRGASARARHSLRPSTSTSRR
jgi:hypothetical protein